MKMNHYLNVPGLLRRFAKIGLALLLVLSVAFGAGAQDVSPARVSGTVVDQQGMPVVGAGVVVRGTQTGSVTDLDGRFTVMAAKDATLTVSFIGYTTREVPVGTQTDIRIVLEENVQSIDDVVVVGFGTQKKETVTGAIGQLSGKELMRSPVTNISNALVGRIAGMAAVQKTGEAGFEESTIRVRGVGTYAGDQNPLIVIDGIVRDMTAFNMLDPNDVKNVNVLKDASATAVYGVRGANGVIIVTTKRGREGNLKISFTANVGFTSPTTLPSLVNSYDYAVLRNEAFANDGKPDDIKVFSQDELWKFRHNRDYTPSEVEAMGTPFARTETGVARQSRHLLRQYGLHEADFRRRGVAPAAVQRQYLRWYRKGGLLHLGGVFQPEEPHQRLRVQRCGLQLGQPQV